MTKWNCFHRKTINCSDKYIKFNEIKNNFFLYALLKSDVHWDGKQEFFLYGHSINLYLIFTYCFSNLFPSAIWSPTLIKFSRFCHPLLFRPPFIKNCRVSTESLSFLPKTFYNLSIMSHKVTFTDTNSFRI